MISTVEAKIRFLANVLVAVPGLLLAGCSLISGPQGKAESVVQPYGGASVTAVIEGTTLIITNNHEKTIYQQVYPTDILPAIEWAPCIAPESCPVEQRIDPGEEKRIDVKSIVGEDTESITVFWWTYLEKLPGASVPPMEMEEFLVPLP
jgi:hypothetical protein